jgi:hypothetical protein
MKRPVSSQSIYDDVVRTFLKHAVEKDAQPVHEIESWERFIPDTLRFVLII